MWTRRQLLAAGAASGLLPLTCRARAATPAERRFLFVFAQGGWDPAWFFAPVFDGGIVEMPDGVQPGQVGNIPFVEHASVPSARAFLEAHGSRTAVVNGFEVRGVAHDLCRRLTMTNSAVQGLDDWPAILAGRAAGDPLVPLLHLSGPSYSAQFASAVVRTGTSGQLPALLDGRAFDTSDRLIHAPSMDAEALEDAAAALRAQAFADDASGGRGGRIAGIVGSAEGRIRELQGYADRLAVQTGDSLIEQLETPLSFLSAGLSRCAMVAYEAWEAVFNGWDTHEENSLQANHYNELLAALHHALDRAAELPGVAGGSLADELVVVVLSEMGRTPRHNDSSGKDHWAYTSAMIIGAGVQGDQAVGGYDQSLLGQPVALESGAVDAGGVNLLPGHIGATLLTLGDVDPAEFVAGAEPLWSVLA